MNVRKKLLSVVLGCSMLVSALGVPAMAEPGDSASENFNVPTDVRYHMWAEEVWSLAPYTGEPEFRAETSFAGRDAGEDDMAMTWDNDGTEANYLIWVPGKQGMETVEQGNTVEYSFDMAIESKPGDLEVHPNGVLVSLNNPTGYPTLAAGPIEFYISHRSGSIWSYAGNGQPHTYSGYVLNPNGVTTWNRFSMVARYDGNDVGQSQIYINGNAIGNPITFTYEADGTTTSLCHASSTYPTDSVSFLTIMNNTIINTDTVWMDNVVARKVDYTGILAAFDTAEAVIDQLIPGSYSPYALKALEDLLTENEKYKVDNLASPATQAMLDDAAAKINKAAEDLRTSTPDNDVDYIPVVTDDFNDGWQSGETWNGGVTAWQYVNNYGSLVSSNGLFGRTASAGDQTLKWINENMWANGLYFTPQRLGLIDYYPRGMVMETSFDFAVEPTSSTLEATQNAIRFSLNQLDIDAPIQIEIPHKSATITTIKAAGGDAQVVNQPLNPDGTVTWHKLSLLVRYDDDTTGTGTAAVYLDGEPLGTTYQFTYKNDPIDVGAHVGVWTANSPYVFFVQNMTWYENSDSLYMDNLSMAPVAQYKTKLEGLLEEAYDVYQTLDKEDALATELENKMAAAWSAYNGKESTHEGVAKGDDVLYPQSFIDTAIEELEDIMSSVGLSLTPDYNTGILTAKMIGKEAVVLIAAYDSQDNLLQVVSDAQSVKMDMTQVGNVDYVKAFAWESLANMAPAADSIKFTP